MKIENLEELQQTTEYIITTAEPTISEYVPLNLLTYIVMNIYLNNDVAKAVTNHVNGKMTIIATWRSVSVIWDKASTNYRVRQPLCNYENLYDDIETILSCIDICIDRLLDQ